jgi:hypothetical protein
MGESIGDSTIRRGATNEVAVMLVAGDEALSAGRWEEARDVFAGSLSLRIGSGAVRDRSGPVGVARPGGALLELTRTLERQLVPDGILHGGLLVDFVGLRRHDSCRFAVLHNETFGMCWLQITPSTGIS